METMNKVIEVTVDVDVFIIPIHVGTLDMSWSHNQDLANFWKKVSEINGLETFNPENDIVSDKNNNGYRNSSCCKNRKKIFYRSR